MPVKVKWQPIEKGINIAFNSDDLNKIRDHFGDTLSRREDLGRIQGMAIADDRDPNPYNELAEILVKHGEIRIWGEW